ncbi:hypothetical protein D3C77_311250 [compost metagenome]
MGQLVQTMSSLDVLKQPIDSAAHVPRIFAALQSRFKRRQRRNDGFPAALQHEQALLFRLGLGGRKISRF